MVGGERARDVAGQFCRKAWRGLDLTGHTYGRLTVIRSAGFRIYKGSTSKRLWLCRCSCGSGKRVVVVSTQLRRGHRKSCGCILREHLVRVHAGNVRHGHARRNGRKTKTYSVWEAMLRRCLPPDRVNPAKVPYGWKHYGGRGVRVCKRWHNFRLFLKDLGPVPEGKTLSRFGDVGDYRRGNVAWHTRKEQAAEAAKKRRALAQAA
jgi:hypothetical protein